MSADADPADPGLDPNNPIIVEVASTLLWAATNQAAYGVSVRLSVEQARTVAEGLLRAIDELSDARQQ